MERINIQALSEFSLLFFDFCGVSKGQPLHFKVGIYSVKSIFSISSVV